MPYILQLRTQVYKYYYSFFAIISNKFHGLHCIVNKDIFWSHFVLSVNAACAMIIVQSYQGTQAAFKEVTKKFVLPKDTFVYHTMKTMRFVKNNCKK